MSTFAEITEEGFKGESFQQIRQELKDAWKNTFGSEIDLSETSPDGHHIDLEAATVTSVVQLLQAIQASLDRNSATGVYLDRLAAFMGLTRNEDEEDDDLRTRIGTATIGGLATYDSMLTYLRDTLVSTVTLAVNDEAEADPLTGIPAHSFCVSVPESYKHTDDDGNDNTADFVAAAIWHCKPAGIASYGDKYGSCDDAAGASHKVYYISPTAYKFDVKVTVTLYDEESYPSDAATKIEAAIREWATTQYTAGKDIIAQRISIPVYSAVDGIETVSVKVSESGAENWVDTISVGISNYASVDTVTVAVAG